MKLKERIRKILNEETLKDSLTDLIKTDGIQRASKTVGGFKRLAKILEIDLDDINDQAKLVKDFIYSENVEGVEVLFIEERTGRSGGKIIDVHLKHYFDDNVSYIDSWYKQIMLDKFKKLFPFDVRDVGHPVFFSTKPKISLDCHVIEDEDIEDDTEDDTENVTENVTEERNFSNEFKRRVKELDILIRAVLEEIYPCDYRTSGEFIEAIIDDVIWVARTKFDDDVYMMVKKNVPDYILDYKKRELTDIFIQVKEECDKYQ
jgi:hypothetical protein